MFLLGLTAAICFVPGYTGATVPTQWVLFSFVLPAALWRPSQWTQWHLLIALFLGYAALSLAWTHSLYDGIYELWMVTIWALAFYLGATLTDLRPFWRGLALGIGVSSLLAIAQALGYAPVLASSPRPSGLFFNPTVLGAYAAVTAVALIVHAQWRYLPALAPALALAQSRGAWAVLTLTLVARYLHWTLACALGLAGASYYLTALSPSDSNRLDIWATALRELRPFGQGVAGYNSFYFISHDQLFHVEFVHNDLLQLIFNYGVAAALPAIVLLTALRRSSPDRWPLLTLALLSLFWFPLWAPVTALAAFLCAGHLLRSYDLYGDLGPEWRLDILSRASHSEPAPSQSRHQHLPVQPRASH